MSAAPRLSIVVVNWNTVDLLRACLGSLDAVRDEVPFETIVVDNGSADGSADMVAAEHPDAVLVRHRTNEGYAIANNAGARRARGDSLLFLNSDTEVRPGALATLVRFLDEHPGHGACAPRLVFPDGTVQRSCKAFPTLMTAVMFDTWFGRRRPDNRTNARYFLEDFDHLTSRDVDQPPGAAFVVRRALFEDLGGFDEELWLFFNDVDLARRIWDAGHAIAYVADAVIVHHEGKSTSRFEDFGPMWHRNRCAYYRKTFGLRGALVARVMSTWRAGEELLRLRREHAPAEARRRVRQAVREVWSA